MYTHYEFLLQHEDDYSVRKSVVIEYVDKQRYVSDDEKQSHFFEWVAGVCDAFQSTKFHLINLFRRDENNDFQMMEPDDYEYDE